MVRWDGSETGNGEAVQRTGKEGGGMNEENESTGTKGRERLEEGRKGDGRRRMKRGGREWEVERV